MRGGKDERIEVNIEKNPYANIDATGATFEFEQITTDLKYATEELAEYMLPKHQQPIEYFKILYHDIYECEKRYLPNTLLTIT